MFISAMAIAQSGTISGNFQTDLQYYLRDTLIDPTGEAYPEERVLATGYLNLNYQRENFMAGVRYENYQNNRIGLPIGYKGEGITYRFARFFKDDFDITAGNFYEQFGSGIILRTYEERGLGLDNNLDGLRVIYSPGDGIQLKGVIGRQRNFFEKSNSIVRGFDAEWNLANSLKWEGSHNFIIGAGLVSKYQEYESPLLNYPNNVAAGALRLNYINNKFNLYGEYAYKANDPSLDNFEIYRPGHALYFTGSFTDGAFGASLSAKYYDNFSFRSDPSAGLQQLLIGYLPSATTLHTYALPALYAYNVSLTGEQGVQAELSYRLKRGSRLGGKYGTTLSLSGALSGSLSKDYTAFTIEEIRGTDGYTTNFLEDSELYFIDIHAQIKRKLNKDWKAFLSGYYFRFNNTAIRKGPAGVGEFQLVNSPEPPNTFDVYAGVLELLWNLNNDHSLRSEWQLMLTDGQDDNIGGDWALVLLEYSIAPHWFFTVQDAYNYGNKVEDLQIHYPSVNVGFLRGASRVQFGYGRQQAGIFCVGGICRPVPASNGYTLSITSNF